ncbi:MAG: phosphatase PAP2 family protein [Candidatus Sphingomonas phytovorans]|nr:phosphatase PAP2 family protein [Sphingomonas sp.]WEJ98061.1 MAG: phosphatase PAP2 family protein [Sphingomonas sp.]
MISNSSTSGGMFRASIHWCGMTDAAAVGTMLAMVAATGLVLTWVTGLPFVDVIPVVLKFVAVALFIGTLLGAGLRFTQRDLPPQNRFGGDRARLLFLVSLLVGLTIPVFGIFKQMVLPMRGFPLDPLLGAIDRILFLGNDPWRLSHALMPSLYATIVLDRLYSLWMPMMVAFPMIAAIGARTSLDRLRLVSSWLLAWVIVGGLAAWLLGSAGPCYYTDVVGPHPGFGALDLLLGKQDQRAEAIGWPIAALDFQPMLLDAYRLRDYAPAGGISAAPSMHVAMATLFAIGGFNAHRWLGWAMSVFAALIWIGSIHLGWHYAVDGLIGIMLTIGIWRTTALMAPILAPESGERLFPPQG